MILSNTQVIILSAGLSKRMGQHKALLKWDEQQTFIEGIVKVYQQVGCHSLAITTSSTLLFELNKYPVLKDSKIKLVENEFIEKGRLFSIVLALKQLEYDYPVFIQNVDNPFVTGALLKNLGKFLEPNAYVNPVFQGKGGHPVLLSAEIANHLRDLDDLSGSLREVLNPFRRINLEWNTDILRNINTPEDYINFCKSKSKS